MTSIYYAEINLTCIILMVMILVATNRIKRNPRMNAYRGMVIFLIILSLSDMIAGLARGKFFFGARFVLWTSNMLYFLSSFAESIFWVILCMYLLYGTFNKRKLIPLYIMFGAASLIFLSSIFTGACFTIGEDNLYRRGPFLWIQWVVTVPCVGIPSFVALFSKSRASKQERIIAGTYSLFPFATMIIQIFVYGITACQVGITLSNVLIYIFIQSQTVDEEKSRAKLLDELSNTDVLTGLNNRRAFENRLNSLKTEEWAGTIFADLNGLKRINDTQGHHAGDQLIIDFGRLAESCFPENDIFRISGDEFVVLSTDRQNFETLSSKLISAAGDQASIGKSDGPGTDVIQILANAEKNMYEEKSRFYMRTGHDRRR